MMSNPKTVLHIPGDSSLQAQKEEILRSISESDSVSCGFSKKSTRLTGPKLVRAPYKEAAPLEVVRQDRSQRDLPCCKYC